MDYFTAGLVKEADMAASAKITKESMINITVFLKELGASKISLQVDKGAKHYQALPRHMSYALQVPFKRESWSTYRCKKKKKKIIVPLEVDKTSE